MTEHPDRPPYNDEQTTADGRRTNFGDPLGRGY